MYIWIQPNSLLKEGNTTVPTRSGLREDLSARVETLCTTVEPKQSHTTG